MRPQIFITHYVTNDLIFLNDMLVEAVTFMEKVTDYPHETIVVYYSPDGAELELFERLPKDVRLIKDDRPNHPGSVPSMRNKIIDLATDYFVILQNDIRVSHGWLTSLVKDLELAESKYGRNCVMSMRFIPYHYIPGIIEPKYPDFWKYLESHKSCISINTMNTWCRQYNFKFENQMVYSKPDGFYTDDGHMLMMFIASRDAINKAGYCDENFLGWGYDDSDWGIRALKNGVKNLQSQTSLIGHLIGSTTTHPKFKNFSSQIKGNDQVFIDKWGRDIFDEMQTGQLWIRLHKEQKY